MKTNVKKEFKQTEIGEIPADWEVVKVCDVLIKIEENKNSELQSSYKDKGKYPIIDQSKDFISGYSDDEKKVYKNNIPLIVFGDHTRVLKYVNFPFVIGADGTKLLKANENKFEQKFFYYSLLNLQIPNRGYNRHFKLLKEQKIPLPPLTEQKKIAGVLSKIQEAVENQRKIIEKLEELKKSTMDKLFKNGLYGKETKQTEIGEIPYDWEVVRLGDVVSYFLGRTPARKELKYWSQKNEGIPWVSISDMKPFSIITDTEEKLTKDAVKIMPQISRKGTLIMSFKLTVGRTSILGIDAYHNEAIISIYPRENILKEFLLYYLPKVNYSILQDRAVKGQTLNKSKIDNILVIVPPLEEQKKIAEILSKIDNMKEEAEKKLDYLNEFFNSALDLLITGKVRLN